MARLPSTEKLETAGKFPGWQRLTNQDRNETAVAAVPLFASSEHFLGNDG
jgi:hypothetical protein